VRGGGGRGQLKRSLANRRYRAINSRMRRVNVAVASEIARNLWKEGADRRFLGEKSIPIVSHFLAAILI